MVRIMIAWVLRTGVAVVANAVALLVAALVLGGFSIDVLPFITVSIIFTLVTMPIRPVADSLAGDYAARVTWVAGLVTVCAGLVIANAVAGDAVTVTGIWTWVWAALIVWLGTLLYVLVEHRVVAGVDKRTRHPGDAASHPQHPITAGCAGTLCAPRRLVP